MLHIYYGKGKGKTSAALGLILRACGYNKRIILFQFLKPKNLFSGEFVSLKKFHNVKQIRFNQKHPIFMQEKGPEQIKKLKVHIKKSILELLAIIKNEKFDILVCDEILNIMGKNAFDENKLIKMLGKLKKAKEVILTGREAPEKFLKIADYVTEFRLVMHPFNKGVLARKSIEF